MRITVTVEGKQFEVDVNKFPFQDTVERVIVNGKPVDINVASDWLKQFPRCLIVGTKSYQVDFELDAQQLPCRAIAMGRSVNVTVEFPGKGKLNKPEMIGVWGEDNLIKASLPGKIIGVRVVPGQNVEEGQMLCLLEAMKMENEVVSPRAGKVKEILVKEGEKVSAEQVLIILE